MVASPMNFNGTTGESHLKAKMKQPAHRTRMHYEDMEYQTAMEDYEKIVLKRGLADIERTRALIPENSLDNHFGQWYKSFKDEDGKIQLC